MLQETLTVNKMLKATHGIIKATPIPSLALNGTMKFTGLSGSNLSIANDANLAMGLSDFTIEWYQYQTDGNGFPRVFSIGSYASADLAVSLESSTFYVFIGGGMSGQGSGATAMGSLGTYKNTWVHFALTREAGTLRSFKNGTLMSTAANKNLNLANTTSALRIANETTASASAAYGGWLSNFRWVKGTALYTSNFNRPLTPLTNVSGTELLLLATDNGNVTTDSSSRARTVTNSSVTWQAFSNTMV